MQVFNFLSGGSDRVLSNFFGIEITQSVAPSPCCYVPLWISLVHLCERGLYTANVFDALRTAVIAPLTFCELATKLVHIDPNTRCYQTFTHLVKAIRLRSGERTTLATLCRLYRLMATRLCDIISQHHKTHHQQQQQQQQYNTGTVAKAVTLMPIYRQAKLTFIHFFQISEIIIPDI